MEWMILERCMRSVGYIWVQFTFRFFFLLLLHWIRYLDVGQYSLALEYYLHKMKDICRIHWKMPHINHRRPHSGVQRHMNISRGDYRYCRMSCIIVMIFRDGGLKCLIEIWMRTKKKFIMCATRALVSKHCNVLSQISENQKKKNKKCQWF